MKPDPVPVLLAALSSRGCSVKTMRQGEWVAQCPLSDNHKHGDAHPSLGITATVRNGQPSFLLNCRSSDACTQGAILSALGLRLRDLLPDRPKDQWTTATRPRAVVSTRPTQRSAPRVEQPPEDLPNRRVWELGTADLHRMYSDRRTPKGWDLQTMLRLRVFATVGFSDGFVFPVRDEARQLVGFSVYQPSRTPKLRAARGRPRDLWPRPEDTPGKTLVLTEGEPDALSAAVMGFSAVSVPHWGNSRRDEWVRRLTAYRTHIVIACDSDQAGRERSAGIATSIEEYAPNVNVSVVDLHGDANDKYDIGDLLRDRIASAQTAEEGTRLAREEWIRAANGSRNRIRPRLPFHGRTRAA